MIEAAIYGSISILGKKLEKIQNEINNTDGFFLSSKLVCERDKIQFAIDILESVLKASEQKV